MRGLLSVLLCLGCFAAALPADAGSISFVPTGTFGDEDGPGSLLIPLDVTADPDGNVYVLDHDAGCVLKYDPDGAYLGRISRRGEGPGELRRPRNLVATDSSRLAVFDLGPRRFSFFDLEGEFLGSRDYQGDVRSLQAALDGTLAGVFRYPERDWIENGMRHRVLLFPSDAAPVVVDSLCILSHQIISRTATATTNVARPFAPGLHLAVLPSGWIVTVHGDRYRLEWIRSGGTQRRVVERDVEPAPVTGDDQKMFLEKEIQDSPEIADVLRQWLEFPARHPVIEGLAVGPRGTLLVLRPGPPGELVCDVFDDAGEFVGTVRGPRPAGRLCFVRGDLYSIGEISDEELPVVTRYSISIGWADGP